MSTPHVTIDPSIFKAYDIRGIYGETLTDEIAYRIGRAAAQYLSVPEIAVGRDMRLSSPQLAAALIRGITDQGVNAIELGKYSPSLEVAFRIAAVFGVPLDQVFQYDLGQSARHKPKV